MTDYTATYSPDDNKLRLYATTRLDPETYTQVKAAGFRWAPKQDLFVAPMWTPEREDLLLSMADEVGDEDTSLIDRAEDRAERFDEYSDKRAADAEQAHAGVAAISDNIPLGQPILVGHHSEKRARKDAQRIENGMKKAVKMWETSEYWTRRAAGAVAAAKYKERADVRARRIKKIEAARRKSIKETERAETFAGLWARVLEGKPFLKARADGTTPSPRDAALWLANRDHMGMDGSSVWGQLEDEKITTKEAVAHMLAVHERNNEHRARWLVHYDNRLRYEKAMLEAQGGTELLKPKPRSKQLPICNYRSPGGIGVINKYARGEVNFYPQVEMTKAEYAAINQDYKGMDVVEHSHRVRVAMVNPGGRGGLACVFLTDSKVHKKPEPIDPAPRELPPMGTMPRERPEPNSKLEATKEALKNGVQVVAAPQLFPTPQDLAQRMIDEADIQPGEDVLEPSAGTGVLVGAMGGRMFGHNPERGSITAFEINTDLSNRLKVDYPLTEVFTRDFLEHKAGDFHKIIMNPPFGKGADIKHIKHAASMLAPGGLLVALCANGPRQQEQLQPMADTWEDLPAGTFKEQGTGVNTALLTIRG